MIKKYSIFLLVACMICMIGCNKKEEDVLHMGLNAEIVEIDAAEHIIYVSELNENSEKILGERCALDCSKAVEKENIIYVNYEDVNDVRTISFEDLVVGDKVILNIYDSELQNLEEAVTVEAIVVEQIQLGTQRM